MSCAGHSKKSRCRFLCLLRKCYQTHHSELEVIPLWHCAAADKASGAFLSSAAFAWFLLHRHTLLGEWCSYRVPPWRSAAPDGRFASTSWRFTAGNALPADVKYRSVFHAPPFLKRVFYANASSVASQSVQLVRDSRHVTFRPLPRLCNPLCSLTLKTGNPACLSLMTALLLI